MTKHNLNACLLWLLDQEHPSTTNLDHTNIPAESSLPALDDGPLDTPQEMARLQIAPQTASKSRLHARGGGSVGSPAPLPANLAAALRPTAASTHDHETYKTPSSVTGQSRPKTPASAYADSVFDNEDEVMDIEDIEEIDLTNDDPTTSSFGPWGRQSAYGTKELLQEKSHSWTVGAERGRVMSTRRISAPADSPLG